MKVRRGFVSNSSSSSFVCDVCGEEQSGWDMGLSDAGMYECKNGHIFCESHAKTLTRQIMIKYIKDNEIVEKDEKIDSLSLDELIEIERENSEMEYCYPIELCPICNFNNLTLIDEVKYYRKKLNTSENQTLKDIKKAYKNYDEFKKAIK